ncbi:hypothetical protein CYLTODRAFT_424418 [Cylindrobasidium torrendii FP15055 ss-10]|uniref:Uncharacterized protein n=1 Tax=Cylindrobasidium torrendii FP15055 ss-10 TaxID=1314674 RepID=A0A0D7B770_9AGAR|nr:hypothetical protein CYLTODRAFT_424418 [Cylindrobasidium torrendii FP15055 ss-10]
MSKRKSPAQFFFDESNRFPSEGPHPPNAEVTAYASSCVVQVECGEDSCTAIAVGGGVYWAPRSIGEAAIQAQTHVIARSPRHERKERHLFPLCYADDVPAHALDTNHALMLSTYGLILRRIVLLHASKNLPSFIPQMFDEGPRTAWQDSTNFCLLYDPEEDALNEWTSVLTPESWAYRLRAEATLVGFNDSSALSIHTTHGREANLQHDSAELPEQVWYSYHTCKSTNTMSGSAIIAPKDAGEVDSSLAGISIHSTQTEIQRFNYNLMIPVKNPLFRALLLVFVWPHVWRCGTPRQGGLHTFASFRWSCHNA